MVIRNCVSEMTNLLTETFEMLGSRHSEAVLLRKQGEGDQVAGDHDKSPACQEVSSPLGLDALPGTHKHVAEGQVLLDILVKDFDSESLAVQSDPLGFAHVEIVGDQEARFLGPSFGDKQKHRSDLGQNEKPAGNDNLIIIIIMRVPTAYKPGSRIK